MRDMRDMPARTPEEVLLLLARALTAGDLESAVALYEPGATFVAQPEWSSRVPKQSAKP